MAKRRRGLIVAILIPLLFVGLVLFQFLRAQETSQDFEPTAVRVDSAARLSLEEVRSFTGHLQPESSAMVIPKVNGRIIQILVKEGQLVQADEVLALLDDEVLQLQAQQARAAWEAAQSQYEKARQGARPEEIESVRASLDQARQDLETARTNYERTRNLYEAGAISQSRFEEVRSAFSGAQTQVENAERSLTLLVEGARSEDIQTARAQSEAAQRQFQLAELQLSYTKIQSPVAGRVTRVLADEGNMAGPSQALFIIISEDTIFAKVAAPESYYGRFLLADDEIEVRVRALAYPDEAVFSGRISRIGSVIDPLSRSFEIEVGLDNRGSLLRPGMYVSLDFVLSREQDALVLPEKAVLNRNGRQIAFAFVPGPDGRTGNAQLVELETGARTSDFVQVLGGLDEGELVIVDGNAFLEDGQEVRLFTSESAVLLSSRQTSGSGRIPGGTPE